MASGGLKPAALPSDEVEAITRLIRPLYEREAQTMVTLFKPVMYRSQVVAGVHYFIKVMVKEDEPVKCVHIKVLRELDPTKLVFSLSGFQDEKTLDTPIEHF